MLRNYLTIALRHLQKSRIYAAINITGLSVGMAACILIMLFVQFELSFDNFHENADRTYRISRLWNDQDGEINLHLGAVAPVVAPLLLNDYGEDIEAITRILPTDDILFQTDHDKEFIEKNILFAEPDFFQIFSFPLLQGNPEEALNGPGKVVLSEDAALRYFDDLSDVVGKQIMVNNEAPAVVTGVIENSPKNSHFQYDVIISFDTFISIAGGPQVFEDNWGWNSFFTYVTLREGVTQDRMQELMPEFLDRQLESRYSNMDGIKPHQATSLIWWPIQDIHLHSNLDAEMAPNSDINLVYTYSAIALLILLVACINFMNLSTARAAKRQKEVGLRKTFGALRGILVRQFLTEAITLSLVALVLAVFLVELSLPFFNGMINRELSINYSNNINYYLQLIGIAFLVGILAGSYPAFYLSKFRPAAILRGQLEKRRKKGGLRSTLVVAQFMTATILLISMGVVHQQLNFLQNKDLQFNSEGILILEDWRVEENFEQIQQDLERDASIASVSLSTLMPSQRLLNSQGASYIKDGERIPIDFRLANIDVDFNFLDLYEINLLEGRGFNKDLATDSSEAFIINKAAAITLGFDTPKDAVNTPFQYGSAEGRIVGVVEDFHFENAKYPISPVLFRVSSPVRSHFISARITPGMEREALAWLENRHSYYRPGYPMDARWVSENFKAQYQDEDRLGRVFGFFSLLTIIISMLGLFGLALHTTQSRLREIGVRKVLGASNWQVVTLLTKGFSILVILAFILGAPLAYYIMTTWLGEFPYHIHIPWVVFILTGVIMLFIALVTVSTQSLHAAQSNPSKTLRQQ